MRARGSRIARLTTTRRAGADPRQAIWLAKQMNSIEFTAAADQLFHEHEMELWVVGTLPDHLTKNHFLGTRFPGFVADLEPIFRSVRIDIVAERTAGGSSSKPSTTSSIGCPLPQ
jgi:hypothetical protein